MQTPRFFPSSFCTRAARLSLALVAVGALFLIAACDRPLVVTETAAGAELLALSGDKMVTGVTTRSLRYGEAALPKGTKVRVGETWLVRKNAGDPPAYRIKGYYDPATRSDGFILPSRSVNIFFNAAVAPAYEQIVPIPQEAFARDP